MKIVVEAKNELGIVYTQELDIPDEMLPGAGNVEQVEALIAEVIKENFPDMKIDYL